MSQVKFYCPDCAFSKEISRSDIPEDATQCRCPSCRKVFEIEEAIQPLDGADESTQIEAELTLEEEAAAAELKTVDEETTVSHDKYHALLDEAMAALNAGNELEAMLLLEDAEKLNSTPKLKSALAYCRAKVKREASGAVRICMDAIQDEPANGDHYLYLGRIYLLGNKRGPALKAFRKGIKLGPHPQLMRELRKYDLRKTPIFSSLSRDHFLNRNLGKLLARFRSR